MDRIKEMTKELKKDLIFLIISCLLIILIFKICFYNENMFVIIRTVISLYWLFIVPGICVTYTFLDKMKFIERFFIGFGIGAAIIGILSYYSALAFLHIKYHGIVLPMLVIIISAVIYCIRKSA